ncbi:hypothetical protein [Kitasatospora indigofera]|uniref:hypothetical protein n=1 Tax=Kitasatospora indigofera TaxID=67307 RepID=UPI0036A60E76
MTAASTPASLAAACSEIAQLSTQLELARSIAVSLEQENAELTATVEALAPAKAFWDRMMNGPAARAARAAAEAARAADVRKKR